MVLGGGGGGADTSPMLPFGIMEASGSGPAAGAGKARLGRSCMLRPDQMQWGDGLWAHERSQFAEAAQAPPHNVGLAPWPRLSTGVSSALQQRKQHANKPRSAPRPQPWGSTTPSPTGRTMGLMAPRNS